MSIQTKKLVIGLFGFGVVGEGLYRVLQQTPGLNAEVKRVCIKHADKPRNAPPELFTTDPETLFDDPEINLIIELIDDADAAFHLVTRALKKGIAVVSANKKLLAEHLDLLIELQQKYQAPLLYEAAACASIPVIRNLEEYYDNDLLQRICGIVNGSTNYILSKIFDEDIDFETALRQAQAEGFAESDPSTDVEGLDARNKLCILLTHAFGLRARPQDIPCLGIQQLKQADADYAREKGFAIKLVAQAQKQSDGQVATLVLPQFVAPENLLYNVKQEYNGVVIETNFADKQFFYGKGAGSFPTASAVLSDLSALRYRYRYEYKKLRHSVPTTLSEDYYLKVYVSFEQLYQVPREAFQEIYQWSSAADFCQVSGLLHISQLLEHDWWKNDSVSLILLPDGIIDARTVQTKKYQRKPELVF
ncbi:MAG: homoserine dehydrogenase [Bacteroidetes bacterium]|nr:homoserine dehydrogenase [Bacteroidota bacterium]